MSDRRKVRNYLDSLNHYLTPLDKFESNEVVKEIESHIYDVIDELEIRGEVADVETILNRLGPPRELAQQYIGHIHHGAPPPEGFNPIMFVKKSLSRSVSLGLMIFGYSFGFALVVFAFANLLVPNGIGVWSEGNGNTIVIGMIDNTMLAQERSDVLYGFWMSPVALIVGYLILMTTHKALQFIRQFSVEPRYA